MLPPELRQRDSQPGNVLISSGDVARPHATLVDFGVSRLLDGAQAKMDAAASVPSDIEQALLAAASRSREATLDSQPRDPAAVLSPEHMADALAQTFDGAPRRAGPMPAPVSEPAVHAGPPSRPSSAPDAAGWRPRSADQLTQAGTILGTLRYMAPELCGGADRAHPPSDVFSFGVMAYEVLTGRMPFEDLPMLRAQREPNLKPLGQLCPGLSPTLASLLERCLSADPERRPLANELAAALRQPSHLDQSEQPRSLQVNGAAGKYR